MDRAIKGLAWYAVIMIIISLALTASQIGARVVFTSMMVAINAIALAPVLALGILILVRMRRKVS